MKLILIYTIIAGVISALTAPIPGTSLLLTALEVFMIVHLAKEHEFKLGFKEIGYSALGNLGNFHRVKRYSFGTIDLHPCHRLGRGGDCGDVVCFLFGDAGKFALS